MFQQLEYWLAETTGFAGVSLQPNAGSQGEYAGLLVIRAQEQAFGRDDAAAAYSYAAPAIRQIAVRATIALRIRLIA